MIIIGFSNKTSKIIPRLVCRKFKHVAPIVPDKNKLVMYQFVHRKKIEKIVLKYRDLEILKKYGWKFICIEPDVKNNFEDMRAFSCVQFTKKAIGIKNPTIQTPWGLYKKINQFNMLNFF